MSQLVSPQQRPVSTIEAGLNLITEKPNLGSVTLAKLQLKELGLSVILLGLAEKAAERIGRLQGVIDKLEDELFNPHNIAALDEAEKIDRYNMATSAVDAAASYIKSTVNTINWDDMETRMTQLSTQLLAESSNQEETDSGNISKAQLRDIANELLSQMK